MEVVSRFGRFRFGFRFLKDRQACLERLVLKRVTGLEVQLIEDFILIKALFIKRCLVRFRLACIA